MSPIGVLSGRMPVIAPDYGCLEVVMFAKLFGKQQAAVVLPGNPREWDLGIVNRFLNSLNPRKERDREQVRAQMQTLEYAIQTEMRAPFTSVKMVLQTDDMKLPVQLRAYKEMYQYMQIWLW